MHLFTSAYQLGMLLYRIIVNW